MAKPGKEGGWLAETKSITMPKRGEDEVPTRGWCRVLTIEEYEEISSGRGSYMTREERGGIDDALETLFVGSEPIDIAPNRDETMKKLQKDKK